METDYQSYKNQLIIKAKKKKIGSKKDRIKKMKTKGKIKPKKIAEKILKENMRKEYQISLTVDGSTEYVAGGIIELDESFGKFSGKYIIDKVIHKIDGDYSCDIEAIKVGARENAVKKTKEENKNGNNKTRRNKLH